MNRPLLTILILVVVAPVLMGQQFVASGCESFTTVDTSTSFVLVVDRSGSMEGAPLAQAREAVRGFIDQVRPDDRVAIVSFADDVRIDHSFAASRANVPAVLNQLRAGGGTRLHDAIAAGVRLLQDRTGIRVVVYLTDGNDNRSNLSLRNIRQMNVGENTIVYGIGLGNIDHASLREVSRASNGAYQTAREIGRLASVYDAVQSSYYQRYDAELRDAAGLTVTSLPAGRPVMIDGRRVGQTPLRLDGLSASTYRVEVEFDRGTWVCEAEARAGFNTSVSARERDVPLQLIIETAPTRAAVFLNGDYVGLSSMVPSRGTGAQRDLSRQLTIDSVPPGRHTVRVVAAPELEFSSSQVMEFPVEVRDEHVFVKALIFFNQIEDISGSRQPVRSGGSPGSEVPRPGFGGDAFDDIRSRIPGQ